MKKLLSVFVLFFLVAISCVGQNILMFVSHEETYYTEYIVMKEALEAAGYSVDVRSASAMDFSIYMTPYDDIADVANSLPGSSLSEFQDQFLALFGSAWDHSSFNDIPDFASVNGSIMDVEDFSTYDGLIVVGGLGSLQYRVDGDYESQGAGERLVTAIDIQNAAEKLNELALEALIVGKPVMAQCHGASIPAFWRIPDTSGPGGEALGYSLLKGGISTGYPEAETGPTLESLDITYRSSDRVTISSPHESLETNNDAKGKILTSKDWYPQTVAHAARTFLNVLETYPSDEKRTQSTSVLVLHGGALDDSDMPASCRGTNKSNDVPCNNGISEENLPADYTHLVALLSAEGVNDDYTMNVSDIDLSQSLPFDINSETEILNELESYDQVIFFKHWSTFISDELQNALVSYADNGGGVLALHHGLYNDVENGQNKDILANQLFGAHSTQDGWSATLTEYTVHSTNYGHFISSYLIDYDEATSDPSGWNSTPLPISANTPFSTTQNFTVYDELYDNIDFTETIDIGRNLGDITPLFSNDYEVDSISHTTGFTREVDIDENGIVGRVVYFEIGERKENYELNSTFGQIIRNAVIWSARENEEQTLTDQSIDFSPTTTNYTYGDPVFNLEATASSGLEVSFSSSNEEILQIEGDEATIVGTGTVMITASQEGNEEYNAAANVDVAHTINNTQLTVTADDKTKAYGEANPELTMTFEGFVNSETSEVIDLPTISTEATSSSNVSEDGYPITLSGGSADNYEITLVNGTLSIEKADQEITIVEVTDVTFGDAPITLASTASSDLAVSYSVVSGPGTLQNGNELRIDGAGTIELELTQPGDDNYNAADAVTQTIEVAKAEQTISIEAIENKLTTDSDIEVQASSSSGLSLTLEVSGPATVVSDFTIGLTGETGTVVVTVTQAGDDNYLSASASVSFNVNDPEKENQEITVVEVTDVTFGDAPITLTSTASSDLAVSYSVVSGPGTLQNGNELRIDGAGTIELELTQPGDDNYNAADAVTQTIEVAKAEQTISIEAIENKLTTDSDIEVQASSSSGLSLTLEVSGPATVVSDFTIELTGETGTVVVTVTQAGDDNYLSASASVSFNVEAVLGSITGDEILIFPNPVNSFLKIESKEEALITVRDLSGKNLMIKKVKNNGVLDFSTFDQGVFILEIKLSESIIKRRILKSN